MESKAVIASLKEKVGKLLADNRMLRAELKKLVAERDRTALQKRNAEEKTSLWKNRCKRSKQHAPLRVPKPTTERQGCASTVSSVR